MQEIFLWAREVNPDQPLSAGIWNSNLTDLNAYQLSNSDVISYHDYNPVDVHRKTIDTLKTIRTHKLLLLAEGSRPGHFGAGFRP